MAGRPDDGVSGGAESPIQQIGESSGDHRVWCNVTGLKPYVCIGSIYYNCSRPRNMQIEQDNGGVGGEGVGELWWFFLVSTDSWW